VPSPEAAVATAPEEPLTYAPAQTAPWVESHHGEVRRVASADRCVALTFDDGPHQTLTPRLLEILAEENVHATFFLVGQRVAALPGIARAIHDGGHEIGNHSWSHARFSQLSSPEIGRELAAADQAILAATGVRPAIIRIPYDDSSPRILAMADRPVIFWDIDTLDWQNRVTEDITQAAMRARPGSIILMHDIHATTLAAVRGVINGLEARGFIFVTVSEMLASPHCGTAYAIRN
jgi:peptidoglycan/xylan/chitin deacetylase (PgdA/CDA1 family)